jgi:hypothetical protein
VSTPIWQGRVKLPTSWGAHDQVFELIRGGESFLEVGRLKDDLRGKKVA